MRTKLRSKVTLLFIVCAALIAIPAIALADNVQNDVGGSGISTITAGNSTTVKYSIKDNNGDGESGCNATTASPATATINTPAGVSASPSSLTFTSCNTDKSVVFSSNTPGDYNITVSVADSGPGTYNVNPAKFTLHVNAAPPPANTPPTLTLPANQTVEATKAAGADVTYTATASDQQDGSLTPTCTPASGATFALGTTQVDCSVTDSGGLTTTGFFTVTVVDSTPPQLTLPSNQTAEATGPNGASVTFAAPTANDIVDGAVTPSCDAASGDTFPLGTTTVHCTATDAHGNSTSGNFTVTVTDNTPPSLNLPDNQTAEATGPNGATVNFNATANDIVDGSVTPDCDAASGDTFPLGTTTVHCTATDAHGNTSSGSFDVTVRDTTGPALSLPANITKTATSNSQVTVNFTATANDLVDGSRPVSCNPASGSSFSAGTTTVNCSSSDSRGNTSNGSFTVTVNYNWTGFFSPIDNGGIYNVVKAGSSIPIKFSLSGNQGLNIFAAGSPSSQKVACNSGSPQDTIEEISTPGSSGLSYDASTDRYNYVWKSDKAWGGTCRQLTVKLADGSTHTALFNFTK